MNGKLSLSRLIKFSLVVLLTLLPPSALPAVSSSRPPVVTAFCACCHSSGTWGVKTQAMSVYDMGELNRLTPDAKAVFYATEGWPDDVSGVSASDDDLAQEIVVSIVRQPQIWKLFFKTSKGETGALVLTIPKNATFFDADIEDIPKPDRYASRAPAELYKEIRLEGVIRGTGIFAVGIVPKTKYRLVLQGRGNLCMSAENFYRWNLRVSGPKAEYTLYGFFAKPYPD